MYFITAIDKNDTRCIGYFTDPNKAIKTVINNVCDINEAGCYPYVVIEHISEGLYQYDREPMWFKFDETNEKYVVSTTPEYYKNDGQIGFAIG